ncbi:MAG: sodium-dependent transporter, partial [Desulfonatronovibrio sp.]
MVKKREQWTTSLAFILAATGSAVGLGNIWRFSYVTGTNGGAAFVLIYLLAIIVIGYPLIMTEVSIGRKTQRNPVGAFWALAPNTPWWIVGGMAVTAGFVILSFYSIVAGWSLAYIFKSISGFTSDMDFAETFVGHISSVWPPIVWHAVFMILTLAIIASGVVKGIQRWVKILMPALFIILLILVFRSVTLEGAAAGMSFYLTPRFGDVTSQTFLAAIGQAFFTLSLGMGAMITYGSYLKKDEPIPSNAAWVVGLDTSVAVIAGFAIFPAVFALGFDPATGPGLAFITLPAVFAELPLGSLFGFLFFLLLAVAALTSAISLLEVVVSWVVDEKGWSRGSASIIMGIAVFLMGIPCTLGYNLLGDVSFLGMDILDTYDFIASDILLPLGGLLTAVFAGYIWTSKKACEEMNTSECAIVVGSWYGVLIRYVVPVAIVLILVVGLYQK